MSFMIFPYLSGACNKGKTGADLLTAKERDMSSQSVYLPQQSHSPSFKIYAIVTAALLLSLQCPPTVQLHLERYELDLLQY